MNKGYSICLETKEPLSGIITYILAQPAGFPKKFYWANPVRARLAATGCRLDGWRRVMSQRGCVPRVTTD